jgi:MFS family permease
MVIGFVMYTIWTMACAVAPDWPALLIFRFLAGVFASAPIACVGGLYADIFSDPTSRGMAMAYFMVATTLGPILAPVVSGFIAQSTNWRWVFATGTFFALATLPFLIIMPESYLPVLLSRKAKKLREETGNPNIIAATDLQKKNWSYVITVVMTRPFRMLFQEAIVSCVCLYAMLVYSIFYLYFQSYPLVFVGPTSVYNFSPGLGGCAFLAIFVGSCLGMPIFIAWDRYLGRKQAEGAKWAKQEEYRRLPLACLGGPLFAASIFWLGWSAKQDVHWIVPILSGVPFGMAFLLIFMALLNYLSDAYLTFAASAQGMASTCRSLGGAVLPIAGRRMFMNLGIGWACSLLGFLSLGVAVIPFVFIAYGDKIRANSKFCQELRKMMEEQKKEEEKAGERKRRASEKAETAQKEEGTGPRQGDLGEV